MPITAWMFVAFLFVLLTVISVVDWRQWRIPDPLNLLLAAGGMAQLVVLARQPFLLAIAIATVTFASLWLLRLGHETLRGRTGLGLGDVKMAGAATLWLTAGSIWLFLFVASLAALAWIGVAAALGKRFDASTALPFGPFLAIGLFVAYLLESLAIDPMARMLGTV